MSSDPTQQTEFQLNNTPSDGISRVKFSPNNQQFLLVSSWDCTVRLYDVIANNLRSTFRQNAPMLDCTFLDGAHGYSGGLDCQLKTFDLNTNNESVMGQHDAAIRCVHGVPEYNMILTGSWDNTVRVWDPRSSALVGSHAQPDKVYTMDTCGENLVVGTSGRKVLVWDLRNMQYPQQRRDSSLKYQTRCIRCFPNGQGFVQSSIEGRVAVEYLDPAPETQKKKYAFKCHRVKADGLEKVYPVNAVSFHKIYNTFVTGGSDGYVNIWDGFNKKRLSQFHPYPTTITSLDFSDSGSVLAIASSYMYEQGELAEPIEDSIFIRNVTDQETKPK